MDDVVERLRHADVHSQQRVLGSRIFGEAADLIEAQRADLAEQKQAHGDCIKRNIALCADITRLSAGLEEARKALEAVSRIAVAYDGLDDADPVLAVLHQGVRIHLTVADLRRAAAIRKEGERKP